MSQFMQDRARRGAEWLDEVRPGWHEDIKGYLDIKNSECCVVGHLEGSYNTWSKNKKQIFLESHGFYCKYDKKNSNWMKLTAAWANEINTRKNNKIALFAFAA